MSPPAMAPIVAASLVQGHSSPVAGPFRQDA